MSLQALREEDTAATGGNEIRSWDDACPPHDENFPEGPRSGIQKPAEPDDTILQPDAAEVVRRRSSGPRRRVTLTADVVRDALEQRFREDGKWEELVDLYLGRVEVVDAHERVEIFKRLADVLRHELEDPREAQKSLAEALALSPGDDDVAAQMEDIAGESDDGWAALIAAVAGKLESVEGKKRSKLAERLVGWCRAHKDKRGAEKYLGMLREVDPGHPLVHRRLATVYKEVGAWDAERDALQRAFVRADKSEDRLAIHVALGELYEERLKNPKLAVEEYERALKIDPGVMSALAGLERICRTKESYTRLAHVLDRQIDAAGSTEDRVGALVRLGDLLERRFLRPREAAPKFELALELDPGNLDALDGLERCWYAVRDWEKLAATLERRGGREDDRGSRDAVAALMRLAEVRESKQESLDGALAAWRRVYELDTSHVKAIQELARLSEKQGDVTGAAAYRSRLADLTDDAREKARIHVAVGEMLVPEGRDPAAARIHFERAVEMDPRNVGAWEHLQKLASHGKDMMYATFCLERRAQHTDSARPKAQLLVELAKMRAGLGDARGALATHEYAFETDATNEAAARAVLEDWVLKEKWQDAQRACDLLVAATTRDGDDKTLLKLLRLSTRIALALHNADRALLAATAALDLAPTDAGARDDALHVCHELRRHAEVLDRVRTLVERVSRDAMDLSPASLVRLGEVRVATGDEHGGIEMLCLALAHDADNRAALETLGKVFLDRHDWARAANCLHRRARLANEAAERHDLYVQTADVWQNHTRAPARAAAVLEEALDRDPRDAVALGRLVALYNGLGEWEKLAAVLRTLAELEVDGARRSKHIFAMADVVREKIGDVRRAASLYEEVLDLQPGRLDAFEHLVRIWTDLREWSELESSYKQMLGRVQDARDKRLEHALHHQLGIVYRDRLADVQRALECFRRASELAPWDDDDRRIVVELLVMQGRVDFAISVMRRALRHDAARASTYRELYDLYLRKGASDRAWCAANALAHLGQADAAQERFAADFPPLDLVDIPGTLAPCAWGSHVLHPDIDSRMTAIFRYLVPAVVRARMARVPQKSRMRWLGQQVRENDSAIASLVVGLVRNGAEVLGVPAPLLLSRPKLTTPFAVAPTPAPALFVSLPAAEAVPPELLVFLVGRRLAELRPELVAHALFPTLTELRSLLMTALRVAVTTPSAPSQNPDEIAIARALEPFEMEGLREAVSAIVGTEAQADLRRWLQFADLSISRAALVLTGDFDTAWQAMQREARSPGDLPRDEWRKHMLAFSVSEKYGELRSAIGVSVDARV
jgi:tetratricopeptide (TPR) repeat protein